MKKEDINYEIFKKYCIVLEDSAKAMVEESMNKKITTVDIMDNLLKLNTFHTYMVMTAVFMANSQDEKGSNLKGEEFCKAYSKFKGKFLDDNLVQHTEIEV